MTRSQIEYILTLDQLRNFSKAADACFVTQSTLSAMVAKYERQIGVNLFNRKTKPLTTTTQGEIILKALKSVYREIQLLDATIDEIKGIESGNLSLACIPTVASNLYPLILDKMSHEFPMINFTVHELTTEQIVEEIKSGSVDIGIVSVPLEDNDLKEYSLYHEDFLLYDCGKVSKNTNFKVSEIDLERLWLMEEGHCLRNQVGKICELRQQKKINGNLVYSCGTIFTLIEMVKKNSGVTLIPRLALANNNQINNNRIYNISDPVPTREIGLVTHKNFLKKRMLQYLVDTIKEVVAPYLPVDISKEHAVKPF